MIGTRKRKNAAPGYWMEEGITRREFPYPIHEVEEIVDKRYDEISKSHQYLVKWEGFKNGYNTWEPESSLLEDVPEMVIDYNDKFSSLIAEKSFENII